MKKTKGKQNYLIHKIKERKINYGIVMGKTNLLSDDIIFIDSGQIPYEETIEFLEEYLNDLKAERDGRESNTRIIREEVNSRPRHLRLNMTEALPVAIGRDAVEGIIDEWDWGGPGLENGD